MMLSSNQVLEISGSMRQLAQAIKFVMIYSDYTHFFTRNDRPAKCVYQTTDDGLYCIGWSGHGETPPDGWKEYPFDYDPDIIGAIAQQWLENAPKPVDENMGNDGSHNIGFLLQESVGRRWEDQKQIKNGHRCIFTLRPFWCFYAK